MMPIICVIDNKGTAVWRGKCASTPEACAIASAAGIPADTVRRVVTPRSRVTAESDSLVEEERFEPSVPRQMANR
jgi:hypothetical protein